MCLLTQIGKLSIRVGVIAAVFMSQLFAQQTNTSFQYFYDDLGQLTKIVDSTGTVIEYVYDPVGNILQIKRSTVAGGTLAVFDFTPQSGGIGQTVTIQGKGFGTTPADNSVQFNGTPAIVTSTSPTTLVVTVPAAATTGPISVTVSGQTATSSTNFTVSPLPIVISLSRKSGLFNTSFPNVLLTGINFSGATFTFQPLFSPPTINVTSSMIAPSGASAILSLNTGTRVGTFVLVATIAAGSSSLSPSTSNRFTVVNPASTALSASGIPDVIEAIYGLDPLDPNSVPNPNLSPSGEADAAFSVLNTAGANGSQQVSMEDDPLNFSVLNLVGVTGGQPTKMESDAKSFSVLNTAGSPGGASGGVETVPFESDALPFSVLNLAGVSGGQPMQMEVDGVPFSVQNGTTLSQQQFKAPAPGEPSTPQKKSDSASRLPVAASSGITPRSSADANTNSSVVQANVQHRKQHH